jgi:hypothetical protein
MRYVKNLAMLALCTATSIATFAQEETKPRVKEKKIVIVKREISTDTLESSEVIELNGDLPGQERKIIIMKNGEGWPHMEKKIIIGGAPDGEMKSWTMKDSAGSKEIKVDVQVETGDAEGDIKVYKIRKSAPEGDFQLTWKGAGELPADIRRILDEEGIDLKQISEGKSFNWVEMDGNEDRKMESQKKVIIIHGDGGHHPAIMEHPMDAYKIIVIKNDDHHSCKKSKRCKKSCCKK